MPVVLAPLVEVVGLIVALGLLLLATALTIALFSFAEKTAGWIPFVGGWSARKVRQVGQAVNSYMTNAASSYAGAVAYTWNTLSDSIRWSVDAFVDLAEWSYRIEWYILKKHPLNLLAHAVERLTHQRLTIQKTLTKVIVKTGSIAQELAHPDAGAIAAGALIVTRPLARDFARFRRQVIARLRALNHAIAIDIPFELKGTRAIAKEAERVASRLWAQVKRLDKVTAGALAAALVATAVGRLGAGWIFCRNWRKVGRSVCRLDPRMIDGLLGTGLAIFALSDICRIASIGSRVARLIEPELLAIVRVTDAALNCTSFPAPPDMHLNTTALPTPTAPLAL